MSASHDIKFTIYQQILLSKMHFLNAIEIERIS